MAAPSPKTDRLRQMREDNFEKRPKPSGSRIIEGLKQALSYAKGEADAKVTVYKIAVTKPQKIEEAKKAVEAVVNLVGSK